MIKYHNEILDILYSIELLVKHYSISSRIKELIPKANNAIALKDLALNSLEIRSYTGQISHDPEGNQINPGTFQYSVQYNYVPEINAAIKNLMDMDIIIFTETPEKTYICSTNDCVKFINSEGSGYTYIDAFINWYNNINLKKLNYNAN